MRIRTQTLHQDFAGLIPQDGSVESVQDYTYFPDQNIRIASTPPPTRMVFKLERFNEVPEGISEAERLRILLLPPPPLNLLPGAFLRVQCLSSFQYVYDTVKVLRVIPGPPGSGSGLVVLDKPLNDDPTPGGQVRRIMNRCLHYVDYRIYDGVEKGKILNVNGRYYDRKNLPEEYRNR